MAREWIFEGYNQGYEEGVNEKSFDSLKITIFVDCLSDFVSNPSKINHERLLMSLFDVEEELFLHNEIYRFKKVKDSIIKIMKILKTNTPEN